MEIDLTQLIVQVGGGGALAWFVTGAVKTAFKLPVRVRPLLAIGLGAMFGIALAFVDGSATVPEYVAGALAGVAAVGAREAYTAARPPS
mgnify:CR=1 FL=1